ncbi:hypothetical protein [uncultured Methylobacterium sp.]|uniref:hypothetical protein n=1 Tax=uncultured Methylobacterium sp. TaxID=157278 RepID=UPI0035CC33C8
MTIIRRRHNKHFTVIGNEIFADESLDLDALGLLCYLRSRPHDWNISTEHLRRRFGCGPEKMQRLMRVLMAAGWIVRQEAPRGPRGTYGGFEYVVLDEPEAGASTGENRTTTCASPESEKPIAVPESGSPIPAEPESVEPESAEPESVNPTPYKEQTLPNKTPLNPPEDGGTDFSGDRISEREALAGNGPGRGSGRRARTGRRGPGPAEPPLPLPADAAARLERLWRAYPESGRLGARQSDVGAAFAPLTPGDQELAVRTAAAYAASCAANRSQARRLDRWLRDGLWRNGEALTARPGAGATTRQDRVFVRDGSPEWEAWARYLRGRGRPMPTPTTIGGLEGWRFDSAMPPAAMA